MNPQKVGKQLPSGAEDRKAIPVLTGVLDYFPMALAAVAAVSRAGNEQHNPGQPIHWARGKSTDHGDCAVRHLMQRGTRDVDGTPHSAKAAWRVLALLQEECEEEIGFQPEFSPEREAEHGNMEDRDDDGRSVSAIMERIPVADGAKEESGGNGRLQEATDRAMAGGGSGISVPDRQPVRSPARRTVEVHVPGPGLGRFGAWGDPHVPAAGCEGSVAAQAPPQAAPERDFVETGQLMSVCMQLRRETQALSLLLMRWPEARDRDWKGRWDATRIRISQLLEDLPRASSLKGEGR